MPRFPDTPARRPWRPQVLALAAVALLGACANKEPRMSPGLETVVLPTVIDYMCEGAQPMRVERAGDARSATVSFASRSWTLARAESAAQEKYAEGTTALYLDGEIAMLESDGRVLGGQCQSKTPMPRAPAMRPYQF